VKDCWYGDNRDLVKWGVLLRLAEKFEAKRILQIAFYRPSTFGQLVIDGQNQDIPEEVISHFRDLRTIGRTGSKIRVTVFDSLFEEREIYLQAVVAFLRAFAQERCVVFLDPDTGLEPQNPGLGHVRDAEARTIWDKMKKGDVFVFYQHRTNRAGQPWIEPKKNQLAGALGVQSDGIGMAHAPEIANDVIFFFTQKA